uniref:Uncharacterized protein n=1 Tax=Rhizophora mucronata TaxID=61149 RepID=A0A2P2IUM9_RHIMU
MSPPAMLTSQASKQETKLNVLPSRVEATQPQSPKTFS